MNMAFDLEKMRAVKLEGHDNILSHVWECLGWGKKKKLENATYGSLCSLFVIWLLKLLSSALQHVNMK